MALDSKEMALAAAKGALERKADDVKIFDMKELTAEYDYFVICSATSSTQTKAITDEVEAELERAGAELARREGRSGNSWILLDYRSVIVHVFLQEERDYYGLEKLWADADEVSMEP